MLLSLSFSSDKADAPLPLLLDPVIALEMLESIADFSLSFADGTVRGDVAGKDDADSRFSVADDDDDDVAAGLAAEEGPPDLMCETSSVRDLCAGDGSGSGSIMAIPLVPGTKREIALELEIFGSDTA